MIKALCASVLCVSQRKLPAPRANRAKLSRAKFASTLAVGSVGRVACTRGVLRVRSGQGDIRSARPTGNVVQVNQSCGSGKVRWLQDADGDGAVDVEGTAYCERPGIMVSGFVPLDTLPWPDCNDSDSNVWRWTEPTEAPVACNGELARWQCLGGTLPTGEVALTLARTYPKALVSQCAVGWSLAYPDWDRDAHATWEARCVPNENLDGWVTILTLEAIETMPDCDDADPSRFRWAAPDVDQDGVSDERKSYCLGEPGRDAELLQTPPLRVLMTCADYMSDEPSPGPGPRKLAKLDCAPNDPSLQETGRYDADGDGFIIFAGCFPSGQAPGVAVDRYAQLDCDDTNSDVKPWAGEYFSDGVDSNCDGVDAPQCEADGALDVPTPEVGSTPILMPTCEQSTDLAIRTLRSCPDGCDAPAAHAEIENRGGLGFDGQVVLELRGEQSLTQSMSLQLRLAPGEISAPIRLPQLMRADYYTLQLSSELADCDTTNNRANLYVQSVRCVDMQ